MEFKKLILPGLVLLYIVSRLFNLDAIPIFTDEAIYSYWAQIALHDPANRFISLEDGKQPLFIWIAAISQYFINDPLLASRFISVLAGLGSTIGIYLLSKELFTKRMAIISSLLYILLPFTLLYDRMALFDSLLTMFAIYAVLLSVKMVKEPKLDLAILNGFAIGLAWITKSSGVIFLYLLPLSLLLLSFETKNYKDKLIKWAGFSLITFVLAQIIYNSLRLSPLFYIINQKNLTFIRSINEVLSDPFFSFISNTKTIINWTIEYVGILLFVIFLFGVIRGVVRKNAKIFYLFLLIIAPLIAEGLFNIVLYPRFTLFYFPFFIIISAYAISGILESANKFKPIVIFAFALAIAIPTLSSFHLLTNPPRANIATSDSNQYINSWPAGYGVKEITQILSQEAKEEKVYVGTEGTFGLLPYAFRVYFFGNENIQFNGYWPVNPDKLPEEILNLADGNKTYFVFNENQSEINNPKLIFISGYQKGNSDSYMRMYRVIP